MSTAPDQMLTESYPLSFEKALNETEVGIATSTTPTVYPISVITPGTEVLLITQNVEIRLARHTSTTSAPTAFATLNFDYDLFFHDPRFNNVTVNFSLKDSSDNRISQFWMPKMHLICGSHKYNGQSEFDPKYYGIAASAAFQIMWHHMPPAVKFKKC